MMFEIKEDRIETDIPRIATGYQPLFQYDRDMLFTGFNVHGARVLGSLSTASREERRLRYFHCLITDQQYYHFINQRLTYLSILKKAGTIFIIDKTFDGVEIGTYFRSVSTIPDSYLPLPEFLCPPQTRTFSRIVTAKLQGGTANQHRVITDTLTDIREDLADIILQPTLAIRTRRVPSRYAIYERPSAQSSYALSFELSESHVNPNQLQVISSPSVLDKFILEYLHYCFHVLPSEGSIIVQDGAPLPNGFARLLDTYRQLVDRDDLSHENIRERLIKALLKSAANLSDISSRIGTSFTNIVLLNGELGSGDVIGIIDEDFSAPIRTTVETIENRIAQVQVDSYPVTYLASIYHLNTDTRQGNAVVRERDGGTSYRPKIHISGDADLVNTKYTESLYQGSEITVRGIARRVDGKIRRLEIEFEAE